MKRKIIKNSKLENSIIEKLVEFFCMSVPASSASRKIGINRHTAERIYEKIRDVLKQEKEKEMPNERLLKYKTRFNFNGTIPIVGIASTRWCKVIGKISKKEYEEIKKRDVINDSLSRNIYPLSAIAIGNFEYYDIVSGSMKSRERIRKFIEFYRSIFNKYYSVRWEDYPLYLNEIIWKFSNKENSIASNKAYIIEKLHKNY